MTAITDKKLRDKRMKEKTLELKKTIVLIKQNKYEKKQEKHNPGSFDFNRRKTHNKRRTDTKSEKIWDKTKNQNIGKQTMQILRSTDLNTITQKPSTRNKLKQMRKKGTLRKSMQTKVRQQPNSEKTNRRRN